ncbi:MAG TPA: type II secretion system minor pseudopilin GspK [Allosphingosinicella sp.]|nr:type II secretion system minor pseudopilin GspK [Allosphingosinicella sp.]
MRMVPRHERGAALLAVLLLVAVMGAIAASALEKLRYSTALATNGAALDQARAYAVGLETLLAVRVDDLLAQNPRATTLAGGWNGQRRGVELPGEGQAEGTIRDGGNCFNVNSVADGSDPLTLAPRPAGIDQFAALMRILGLSEAEARRIAESAADWVDADRDMHARGAEDSAYASAALAYRPGNTLFAEVSELRAVAGVTPEIYARLRPFLCALPTADLSPINVNTLLPDQAPLLAMLSPGRISLDAARAAIARRPGAGWESKTAFWSSRALSGASPPLDASNQVQLSTRWFSLDLRIRFAGAELIETALIDARLRPSRVAVRRWGAED